MFADKELREIIQQDVDRTNQEMPFFRLKSTKDAL
jgi:hypothetical protein